MLAGCHKCHQKWPRYTPKVAHPATMTLTLSQNNTKHFKNQSRLYFQAIFPALKFEALETSISPFQKKKPIHTIVQVQSQINQFILDKKSPPNGGTTLNQTCRIRFGEPPLAPPNAWIPMGPIPLWTPMGPAGPVGLSDRMSPMRSMGHPWK